MPSDQPLIFRIKAIDNQFKRLMDRTAIPKNDANLTGMQCAVLGFIENQSRERDVFQRDVEEEFNIRRSTATGMLQLLEKRGFIQRDSVPGDARLKKITTTSTAKNLSEFVQKNIEELDARLARGISPEELELFYKMLDKISANMQD